MEFDLINAYPLYRKATVICKSSCSVKRKEKGTRGCPCKGRNTECLDKCTRGTRNKPCKNGVSNMYC